jgi:hypothetical protein
MSTFGRVAPRYIQALVEPIAQLPLRSAIEVPLLTKRTVNAAFSFGTISCCVAGASASAAGVCFAMQFRSDVQLHS